MVVSDIDAKLIDIMGDDNRVADAARVSFSKSADNYSTEQNQKLIRYLAKHNHWTPFAHVQLTLHCKAPIFVARQMGKHQVGMVWNEVSRRYVSDDPEFYLPKELRLKAENVKQGSSDQLLDGADWRYTEAEFMTKESLNFYQSLLYAGVCAEQARMFLPQNMMTEWYWTGSLVAFARVCKLRLDPHTQKECRDLAEKIRKAIDSNPFIAVSWDSLLGDVV